MPDLQILKFSKYRKTQQGQLIGPTDPQNVSVQSAQYTRLGVPFMRGDLTMPLNDDGTFGPGEWVINPNTQAEEFHESPIMVYDIDRAMQDVTKGMLTVKGTNYLATNYGTILSVLINKRKIGDVAAQITKEVQYLLGYLAQTNIGVPNTEIVSEIVSLKGTEDKQTINLELTVRTLEGSQGSLII